MRVQSSLIEVALTESLDEGVQAVAVFAADDRLLYANSTFIGLFALDPDRLPPTFGAILRHCFDDKQGLVIDTDDFDQWLVGVQQRRHSRAQRSFESDYCDGRWIWVNESQRPDGTICFIGTDITALKHSESTLRHDRDRALHAANTDPLTGLCNRRHIFACLEAALRIPARTDLAFSLCMMDLDHFKRINDRYGHHAGDLVLQHFAVTAGAQLRPHDTLGRIGGEEFLLLLPDTAPEGAVQVLERLRTRLSADLPQHEGSALRYTFSAGVTVIMPGDTMITLIQRVDVALYAAKHAGRDRCVTSDCGT